MGVLWIFATGFLSLHVAVRPPSPSSPDARQVAVGVQAIAQKQPVNASALVAVGNRGRLENATHVEARAVADVTTHHGKGGDKVAVGSSSPDPPDPHYFVAHQIGDIEWMPEREKMAKFRDAAGRYMDDHDLEDAELADFTHISSGPLELAPPARPLDRKDRYAVDLLNLKNELSNNGKVLHVLQQDEAAAQQAKHGILDWMEQAEDERLHGNLIWHEQMRDIVGGLGKEKSIIADSMHAHVNSAYLTDAAVAHKERFQQAMAKTQAGQAKQQALAAEEQAKKEKAKRDAQKKKEEEQQALEPEVELAPPPPPPEIDTEPHEGVDDSEFPHVEASPSTATATTQDGPITWTVNSLEESDSKMLEALAARGVTINDVDPNSFKVTTKSGKDANAYPTGPPPEEYPVTGSVQVK